MKCIIIDDEKLARNLVESYATKITSLKVIALCKNGLEALEILKENQVDYN